MTYAEKHTTPYAERTETREGDTTTIRDSDGDLIRSDHWGRDTSGSTRADEHTTTWPSGNVTDHNGNIISRG